MKLTRRALFALLPGGLVGRWWKLEPKYDDYYSISRKLEEDKSPFISGTEEIWDGSDGHSFRKSWNYWVVDGKVGEPFNVKVERVK